MPKLYLTNTTAAAGAVDALQEYQASASHTPANSGAVVSQSCAAAANTQAFFWWDVASTMGSATWPTTDYSYSIDISSIGSSLTVTPLAYRVASNGSTYRRTLTFTGVTGTGIKTQTQDWAESNNGTGNASTDRLGLLILVGNSNMMDAETIDARYSDSDSWVGQAVSGSTVPVAQVTNTNTSQAYTRNKRKTLGQARR